MKKRYFFCSGMIALASLLMSPSYATTDGTRVAMQGSTSATNIYVDTLDVDTMSVDAAGDDASDDDIEDNDLPWPQNIVERIDNVFKNTTIFNTSMVGMKVYDLTADSTIYEYNSSQLMRPASTLKMIVAVTALDRLEADYKFKTRLSYTGNVEDGTLTGNIYCIGGFDPTVSNDDISQFVDSISSLGIDTIRGNICLDNSMKDKDRLGEGWCWDDDNPVLSPLLAGRKEEFGERLLKRLDRKGIHVTGMCEESQTPSNAKTLYIKETPLLTVMRRQLKRSDNLYSEAIFYQVAADAAGHGMATAKHGRQAVNRLISKLGFKPSAYYIADGSGLSLYNYVSPELEVAFLKYAYQHSAIYDNLLPCLPVAGEDGTLAKRMRTGAAHGNVKAKTGTVTGVSSLAGYCTAANGHKLCFSIINMGIRYSSSGRNFQDKICQALCK